MEINWNPFESETGLSVARDVSLRRFSSLGIGGFAAGAVTVETVPAITSAVQAAESEGIPVKILGGGTNVVFTDAGFSGLLIRLGEGFKKIEISPDRKSQPAAGAAAHLTSLITRTIEAGLSGVEKLAGIPGTLGGAVYQNSGARDYDTSTAISAVTFWDIREHKVRTLPKDQLEFGYRTSLFHRVPAVILSVHLNLEPAPREKLAEEVGRRMKHRSDTQPTGRSVGCIFKNPATDQSAGELIDRAGLKGKRVGELFISDIHGNFFINTGRATFAEFQELVAAVQSEIKNKFGVSLELEVEIVQEKPTSANASGGPNRKNKETGRKTADETDRPLRGWKISGEGNFI